MGSDAQGKQLYNYQQILHSGNNMHFHTLMAGLFLFAPLAQADTLTVKNEKGEPMARAMVTQSPISQPEADLSDDGYAPDGVTNTSAVALTRFTDSAGEVEFDSATLPVRYRARAQGYVDSYLDALEDEVILQPMTEEQYIASYPSNVWLSQLSFGGDEELKKGLSAQLRFLPPTGIPLYAQ